MNFLNPALLWFSAGAAIPIIIHLLFRQRFRIVNWGAMVFLLAALKKHQRRIRLEQIILLLIRMLIMLLLAFLIARPYVKETLLTPLQETKTHYIFVIDNSYSMGYKGFRNYQQTLLEYAKEIAVDQFLKSMKLGTEDKVSLIEMCEYPVLRLKETNKKETAEASIKQVALTDQSNNIFSTLSLVQSVVDASKTELKKIYIFTDMQRSLWVPRDKQEQERLHQALAKLSSADDVRTYIVDLGKADAENVALICLDTDNLAKTTKRHCKITAKIANFCQVEREINATLFINQWKGSTQTVKIEKGGVAEVTFFHKFFTNGPQYIRVELTPDLLSTDNVRYNAVNVGEGIPVTIIDGKMRGAWYERESGYLKLALDPGKRSEEFKVDAKSQDNFSPDLLDATSVLCIANVGAFDASRAERIKTYVKKGGGVVIALGDQVIPDVYNSVFFSEKYEESLLPAKLDAPTPEGDGTIYHLTLANFSHPMFKAFESSNLRPHITGIPFKRFYKVGGWKKEDVVAYFDSPDQLPAILEKKFGNGRVVLINFPLNNKWNETSPITYLPLMQDLFRYLASSSNDWQNIFVGESIVCELPASKWKEEFRLTYKDFPIQTRSPVETSIPAQKPDVQSRTFTLFYPVKTEKRDHTQGSVDGIVNAGVYALSEAGAEHPLYYIACNISPYVRNNIPLDTVEGNLLKLSVEELRSMYPRFKVEIVSGSAGDVVVAPASEMWRQLGYALAGFLLIETFLAWLFGRNKE